MNCTKCNKKMIEGYFGQGEEIYHCLECGVTIKIIELDDEDIENLKEIYGEDLNE